ncbi:MAG: metalloenzyme, partial [Spirochaetia bacterium]|nr:metalloenzyme [Spirochaetia bacterium]
MIEDFVKGIITELDPENELLLISSDHGNLEDLSVKTHTNNPVMTFAYGKHAETINDQIKALKDIPILIYSLSGMKEKIPEIEKENLNLGD